MDRINDLLPKVLRKRGIEVHAESALVAHRAVLWMREQLPDIADCVRVQKMHEGILVIACTHSVAMQECAVRVSDLAAYLAAECPKIPVKGIRIVRE